MQRLSKKTITKPVGALSVRNTHEEDPIAPSKNHRGITLIALIITIIVMIILVGVTVNVALNGGLFETAQKAAEDTEYQADYEILQAGVVGAMVSEEGITQQTLTDNLPTGWNVGETEPYTVTSSNENIFTVYADGTIIGGEETATLPEGWEETTKPTEWDNDKITAVTDGINTIPLPEGYEISNEEGEHTIEEGVVIKDSKGNEFVWIPVSENFLNSYNYDSYSSEPTELTSIWSSSTLDPKPKYDSQEILTELYGTKEDENAPFYNYTTDFAYSAHYAEMVESVNKYHGFYIGRYETTIDENNQIGSVWNMTVLTANNTIPQTNNKACRWYGLYYTERNSNVIGNQEYIQTNMIWGQQWDAVVEYFDSNSIDYSSMGPSAQGEVVNSGQSTISGNKDKIYNIYDLRTNGWDWTAEAEINFYRVYRGGTYDSGNSPSYRPSGNNPTYSGIIHSSRLTLYVK